MQGYYLRLSGKIKGEQLVDALSIQHVDTPMHMLSLHFYHHV